MTYHLIDDQATLQQVAPTLVGHPRIALDCEAAGFHRYTDRLCLVQLSTPDETFLFDPLTIDPAETLRPVLENPDIQVVMHGSDFDLRLLHRDLGIRVRGLFDTQAAAALLGATAIGLASLLDEHLNVQLSKKHQRADWAQRPLRSELLEYASDDTRHLLALGEILERNLQEAGRRDWASEEFRVLEQIEWTEDQADPVTRIKGARLLNPRQVTALRAALTWRDGIARARDRAPFRVASDSALMTVVLENPKNIDELRAIKGISPRLAQTRGSALLAGILAVADLPEAELEPYPRGNRNGPGRFSPEEESVAEEVRNLRAEKARELGLEKGVVLSNAQITEIIRAAPRSLEALEKMPGLRRWQAGLLGKEIIRVLRGPTGSASS